MPPCQLTRELPRWKIHSYRSGASGGIVLLFALNWNICVSLMKQTNLQRLRKILKFIQFTRPLLKVTEAAHLLGNGDPPTTPGLLQVCRKSQGCSFCELFMLGWTFQCCDHFWTTQTLESNPTFILLWNPINSLITDLDLFGIISLLCHQWPS